MTECYLFTFYEIIKLLMNHKYSIAEDKWGEYGILTVARLYFRPAGWLPGGRNKYGLEGVHNQRIFSKEQFSNPWA
jgi:hypothetical protein